MLICSAAASHRPTPLDVNFTFTDNRIFIIFYDIPHSVRRDIFAFAKVILRLCRSDILFAINTRKANITRLKAVYHCVAIELAVRRIELKKALAIASAFFLVGAGGPELRSAFVCSANLRFIDLWFSSTLFFIKITNRKSDWYT